MRRRWMASLMLWVVVACDADSKVDAADSGVGEAAADAGEARDADGEHCGAEATPPPKLPGKVQELDIGEHTFTVHTAGPEDGELVMLLHGFPQTAREFAAQVRALSEAGYRTIAPNQRGYSKGARPEAIEDYALEVVVQDVLAMADHFDAERFHLVGHDWGGIVGWVVARLAPERLLSLTSLSVPHPDAASQVLVDPESCQSQASSYVETFTSPEAESLLLLLDSAMLRGAYSGLHPSSVDAYLEVFATPEDLRGPLNWYRANFSQDPLSRRTLGVVGVPTMFIWGDEDFVTCRETAELVEDFVDGPYRVEEIEGAGHWLPEVAAEQVNELLLEHLDEYAP